MGANWEHFAPVFCKLQGIFQSGGRTHESWRSSLRPLRQLNGLMTSVTKVPCARRQNAFCTYHILHNYASPSAPRASKLAGLNSSSVYELVENVTYDYRGRGRAFMKKFIIDYHFRNGLGYLTEKKEFNAVEDAIKYIDDRYKISDVWHKECFNLVNMIGKDFTITINDAKRPVYVD